MAWFSTYILMMQLATGLLLIGLALPLIRGRIGPNPWYGFRTPRTLSDPAVWYKANAYAGKALIPPALAMIGFASAFYWVPVFDPPAYAMACAMVTLGSLGLSVIACFRYLGRIDRDDAL